MGSVVELRGKSDAYVAALRHIEHLVDMDCFGTVLFDGTSCVLCPRPGFEVLLFRALARIDWHQALILAEAHDQSGLVDP